MKIEVPENLKLAAAVSGGVDSMVMLDLLLKRGIRPLVLTVDHGIRGDESAEDARFVREYSENRGLECLVFRADVEAECKKTGNSTELQARLARYAFFDRVLLLKKADAVLLAHHLSDQTETVLMRLMRGTGVRGLTGIRDRPGYLHPLLNRTRAEIEEYAFRNSVPFREDKTNLWDGYFRNFVRMRVVPILKERAPALERQIEKLTESARETEDFIGAFLMEPIVTERGILFPEGAFKLHDAVLKRSVVEGLKKIGVFADVGEPALTAICSLKAKPSGAKELLGAGLVARREYGALRIEREAEPQSFEKPFSVTETYVFGDRYEFIPFLGALDGSSFDLDKTPPNAVVRTRRDGDRFRRCNGKDRLLSDYFTDRKTPKEERDRQLLLASGNRVFAVLGEEISDEIKIDETTTRKISVKRRHE